MIIIVILSPKRGKITNPNINKPAIAPNIFTAVIIPIVWDAFLIFFIIIRNPRGKLIPITRDGKNITDKVITKRVDTFSFVTILYQKSGAIHNSGTPEKPQIRLVIA